MRRPAGLICLTLARLIATASLISALMFAGFAVCAFVPQSTEFLTHSFATEDLSSYSRTSLTQAALATRDFTLFSTNPEELAAKLRTIVQRQIEAQTTRGAAAAAEAQKTDADQGLAQAELIPDLTHTTNDKLGFTQEVIQHLQDVHTLIVQAELILGTLGVLGLISFIYLGIKRGRRGIGAILITAPALVFAGIAACVVAGVVNFDAFFNFLHSLVFTQGSWIFPADSLLICMYPLTFWAGMGVIWLLVSLSASVVSLVIGLKLRK